MRESSDQVREYNTGVDRMNHPLSHTAAVVGGGASIALLGCLALLMSDSKMLRSTNWWAAFALSASVTSVSLIGYFRPHSRAIYLPLLLAGAVTLGLCVLHLWWVLDPETKVHPAKGLIQSVVFFTSWLIWAGRKFLHLRAERRAR